MPKPLSAEQLAEVNTRVANFRTDVLQPLHNYLTQLREGEVSPLHGRITPAYAINQAIRHESSLFLLGFRKKNASTSIPKEALQADLGTINMSTRNKNTLRELYTQFGCFSDFQRLYNPEEALKHKIIIPPVEHPVNQFIHHTPEVIQDALMYDIVIREMEYETMIRKYAVLIPAVFMVLLVFGLLIALITQ